MANTFNIPTTALTVGEQIFGPFAVPANLTFIGFHFNPTILPNSSSQVMSMMWLDTSPDGVQPFVPFAPCGLFGQPTFVNSKGGGTDCVTVFAPVPSPCVLRCRTETTIPFSLQGAFVVVSS